MTLKNLESNLQEIYFAAHSSGELVAEPFGRYVYATKAGWGIFWSWVYKITRLMGLSDLEKSRFELAMLHTHHLFSIQLSKVIEACQFYEKNLKKRYHGKKNCNKEIVAQRQCISAWYRSIAPFIHYTKNVQSAAMKRIISINFANVCSKRYSVPFSEGPFAALIKRQRRIIKLEGALKCTLPIDVLIKVSQKTLLNRSEKETFSKFARKIKDNQQNLSIRNLHYGLLNVINKGQEIELESMPDITTLEMELIKIECPMMLQKDPKQMKRREYKPGDQLICNNRLLIVDQRLGERHDNDQNFIYSTDDPTVVAVIGINAVIHPLKRLLAENEGWGIKSAEYIDIDHKSGVALVERLYDPLGSYTWASQSNRIVPEDEDIAMPLWRLLKWFIDKNRTPLNFSPKHLMFDKNGILKCLKVATIGEFDFNALVKFVDETSAGNRHIFCYLMQKSGLNMHKYARFYEHIVKNALQDEKDLAADLAKARGIIDHRIKECGIELEKKVLRLKDSCLKELKTAGIFKDAKLLDLKVREQLIKSYRDALSAGFLPDYLAKEIVAQVSVL